jgi:polyferredoxin
LVEGTYLRHLAPSNGIALALVALSAVALGRVFCGWVCPIGTLQDALAGLARRLTDREAGFPWRVPRAIDRPLRYLKYVVLGWVLLASITAVVPPLAPFCPFRTLFEFNLGSVLSFGIILSLATTSLLVERFWCRYLCPLGALLALLNRVSPIRPRVDGGRCVACGRCEKSCPAGIDPVDDGTNHPECVRCFACVDACRRPGALGFRRQAAVDGNARNA